MWRGGDRIICDVTRLNRWFDCRGIPCILYPSVQINSLVAAVDTSVQSTIKRHKRYLIGVGMCVSKQTFIRCGGMWL